MHQVGKALEMHRLEHSACPENLAEQVEVKHRQKQTMDKEGKHSAPCGGFQTAAEY